MYDIIMDFAIQTSATIVGGLLFTLIFFIIKEKIAPIPKINGRWYIKLHTSHTGFNPYRGMDLYYEIMLWQEGAVVKGTMEKYYEDSSKGIRSYVGENRTRGKINGYIEKNYFSKDKILLHMDEDGHGRESTHLCHLTVHPICLLGKVFTIDGKFESMVASQAGTVEFQRHDFDKPKPVNTPKCVCSCCQQHCCCKKNKKQLSIKY